VTLSITTLNKATPEVMTIIIILTNSSKYCRAEFHVTQKLIFSINRYHCAKCFNFDLCQSCFFVGLTAKGHKADHPMDEYCTSTGKTDNFKIFGKALRNSLRRKNYFRKKSQKLAYLPVNSVLEGEDFVSPVMSPNLSMESRDFKQNISSGSIQKR